MLDRFENLLLAYRLTLREIGDGTGDLQYGMTSPRREREALYGELECPAGLGFEAAVALDKARLEAGVACGGLPRSATARLPATALRLPFDGGLDPSPDRRAPFPSRAEDDLGWRGLDRHPNVDAVQERSAELAFVALKFLDRAEAGPALPAEVPAGAGIGRHDELELRGKAGYGEGAHEGYPSFFYGLA